MYKPATIKDIALALQLSPSTVSRALRDAYQINPETKKLVMDYAKKVNYLTNPMAKSLRSKRSFFIGMVVPGLANDFFSQVIAGAESVAYEKGYNVIVTQSHDSAEKESFNVNQLAQRSVDGLLISMAAGTHDYDFLKNLHAGGLPIVFFDRIVDEINTFKVTSDNSGGAFAATRSLILTGRKKIAVLADAPQLSITQERLSGYKRALKESQLPFRPELIQTCFKGGYDYQEVENAIRDLLAQPERPDAIFVNSDRVSICCMRAVRKLRIDLREISIAGFSNADVADLLQPSFAYITQRTFEMGRIAAQFLLKIIESTYPITKFETIALETDLHLTQLASRIRRLAKHQ